MAQRVHPHATALMYHDVVADGADDGSGFPGRDAALYKVTTRQFERHLAVIAALRRGTAITFDDGGVSAMYAADALERFGLAGHFFVTTNYIGTRGFLQRNDIRALHARGHVVGSHSASHPLRMGHCSRPRLVDEWSRSCAVLEDIIGNPVVAASVPGGDFAPAVAEAAAHAGIARLFTSEPTATVRRVFGLDLHGRYTVQRWTTADTVQHLVRGDWLPRAGQALLWNAKKLSKRIGGERYLAVRRLLIGHDREVRWGDG